MFSSRHQNISELFKYFHLKFKLFSTVPVYKPVKLACAVYESENTSNVKAPFVIAHGLFGSKQNWTSLCKAYSQKIKPPRKVIGKKCDFVNLMFTEITIQDIPNVPE